MAQLLLQHPTLVGLREDRDQFLRRRASVVIQFEGEIKGNSGLRHIGEHRGIGLAADPSDSGELECGAVLSPGAIGGPEQRLKNGIRIGAIDHIGPTVRLTTGIGPAQIPQRVNLWGA